MNRLLVICGPTATGKTSLAINLAKKFGGEIVSADSRQVYQGMSIVTGKDLKSNAQLVVCNGLTGKIKNNDFQLGYYLIDGVRVWLYDVVKPSYQFNAADYVCCAEEVLHDIWRRGKMPMVTGGTGLYIKSLIDGIGTMGVAVDLNLRKKLSGWQVDKIASWLRKIDLAKWRRMNESGRKNPRRLIRAIEVATSSEKKANSQKRGVGRDILLVGLKAPYKFLYQQIDKRVKRRVEAGAEKEARELFQKYSFGNQILGATIGYQQWRLFFEGELTNEETILHWQFSEHAYARRQMTWFKKDKRIYWFDISRKEWQDKVEAVVEEWLEQNEAA